MRCSLSQALRLYIYPYFRPVEPDPSAATGAAKDTKGKASVAGNKKGRSPSPKSRQQQQRAPTITDATNKKKSLGMPPTEETSDQQSLTETTEERQRPALQLQQLNTIIFGLPNLTFTP